MRIAIVSAGPSARITWQGGPYNHVLAVNMGLAVCPTADALVAGDAKCICAQLGDLRPRRAVWTMGDEQKNVWPGVATYRFDTLPAIRSLPRPFNWSIQGALAVALSYEATAVDLYGCDMLPGPDVAGKPGDDRSDDRWRRERADLRDSIAYLNKHGCSVHRITPFPWETA